MYVNKKERPEAKCTDHIKSDLSREFQIRASRYSTGEWNGMVTSATR